MDWPIRTQDSAFISQWKIQLRASSLWSLSSPGSRHSPNGLTNQKPGLFNLQPMRGRANGPEPGIPEASSFLVFFWRLMDWPSRTQDFSVMSQWEIQPKDKSLEFMELRSQDCLYFQPKKDQIPSCAGSSLFRQWEIRLGAKYQYRR